MIAIGASIEGEGDVEFESMGWGLVSAMHLGNSDAKRPGMHSNAKRWNEAAREWPK